MGGFPLSGIDLGVIAAYFVAVLFIGFWVARKTKDDEDLFLAGRKLGWAPIGFSLFASNISSTTLIGLAGAAYTWGIAVSNYEWMAAIILVIFVLFFVPFYIRSRISTVPEFLEKRFDRRSRIYFSGLTLVANVVVDTAGSLFAGAMVLKVFFPGLNILLACIVLAVVAGLYTAAGGLAAVVYTDVIQAVVLLLGTALLTLFVFESYDFSWAAAVAATPPDHLHLIRPLSDPDLPWLGLITGVPILGFWYWTTNQYITQRVLGARDIAHARWGSVLGGGLKLVPLFTMVLPGALAISLLPGLDDPDQVFPMLVTTLLPVGVVGLVLAGLIAAIMSSIDSTLNSASTLVVCDFIQTETHQLGPKEMAKAGRITTLVLMVVAAAWAPWIANFGGLFAYLQQAFSILVPPVAAIFLVGVFWRRTTGTAALVTLIAGHVIGALLFVLGQVGLWPLHFTITAGLMTAVSIAILTLVTAVTKAPAPERLVATTWSPADGRPSPGAGGLRDYRLHAALIAAITVATVLYFW